MTIDYGADIGAVPDLDPMLPTVTGRAVLREALVRRLSTPRGALFYEPDYGYDLRALLSEGITGSDLFAIAHAVGAEVRKDERVLGASVVPRLSADGSRLALTLWITDAAGPFELVLVVSAVTVEVLRGAA